jgi:hypothetical protein
VRGFDSRAALPPHPTSLGFASARSPSPTRGEGKRACGAFCIPTETSNHPGKLHRSRGAHAPEVSSGGPRFEKRGGRRADEAQPVRLCARLLGPRGASRRAVRRSPSAPGRAFGGLTPVRQRAPRGGVLVPPGGVRRRPGACLARARARAPARSPRAGATGSCPSGDRTSWNIVLDWRAGISFHGNVILILGRAFARGWKDFSKTIPL